MRHIGHVEISQWLRELLDCGLSPATVRSAYIVLTMILNLAVEAELLPKNPARKVKAPTVHPRKPQVLTHEQVFAFADAAGEYRTFILLLAYTGLRWGEATALQTSHFDLGNRVVHVDRAFADVRGVLLPGPTKNHQRRLLPLPGFLVPLLEEQLRGRAADGLAFTAQGGGPLHLSNFRHKYFDPARVSADCPWVTPHTLRNTAASLAIAAGADVKLVQAMLGHRHASMTLDVYADFFPSNRQRVADLMSDAAEAARGRSDGGKVIEFPCRDEDNEEARRAE